MHAAIPDRVDGTAFHASATILREYETVTFAAWLRNDEKAESTMRLRTVWVGTCEEHKYVRASAECAPCLDPVDDVAGFARWACSSGCGRLDSGDVTSVVRLGDGDGRHHFSGRQLRQPFVFLRFSTAGDQGASEDLRPSDE